MHSTAESPVVSFERDGRAITLGTQGSDPVLHIHGSTGLGLPPVDIATTPRIGGDGSIVRGVRYGSSTVFIPIDVLMASTGEMTAWRRDLTRALAPHLGPVTVRVVDPVSGSDRRIQGLLKEGLTGDFGDGYHGSHATLGLVFQCDDPWWRGPDRMLQQKIAPPLKPLIVDGTTRTDPFFPVMIGSATVLGAFDVEVGGDGPIDVVWEITGPGTDLVITVDPQDAPSGVFSVSGEIRAGESIRIDGRTGTVTPVSTWDRISLSSQFVRLTPGVNRVRIQLTSATEDAVIRGTWTERFLEGY